MGIKENINMIKENIGKEVSLVAVTKTRSIEEINLAIESGAEIIGENRIQEYELKKDSIKPCKKHMIGHLQRNKAKKAVEYFDLIHSVDSLRLAEEINKHAKSQNKVQEILIQVNIGREEQKSGIMIENVEISLEKINELKNIRIKGLMCIAPFVESEKTREYFRQMKKKYDELKSRFDLKYISMGMTNDYKVAVEEGSNMVRIGTAIFGRRI